MGGSSTSANQSSTSTTTVNKNTSVGLNDELNGNFVQGLENSTVNITDGGAVNKALESIVESSKEAFAFGNEALGVNQAVTQAALDSSENYLDSALNFGRDAMAASENATNSALDVAKNLSLDSDAATARDTNKNMMYSTLAIAVALAFFASKK